MSVSASIMVILFIFLRFVYVTYILHNTTSIILNKLEQDLDKYNSPIKQHIFFNKCFEYQDRLSYPILEFIFIVLDLVKWSRKNLIKDKQLYKEYFGDN